MGSKKQLIVDELGERILSKFDELIIGLKEFRRKLEWNIAGADDDYMRDVVARAEIQINVLISAQDLITAACKEYKEEIEQ
jgi:hypothetical protein